MDEEAEERKNDLAVPQLAESAKAHPISGQQVKDCASRTLLTPKSAISPWSVLILGLPKSSSFTTHRLQALAEGIVRSFEFVPKRQKLVTLVHLHPLTESEEMALVGFDSELVAELFLDTCAQFPLRVDGSELSVARNFFPSCSGDLREVMRMALTTTSAIFAERHVVYVSHLPESWVDVEKLSSFFAEVVGELPPQEVVRSVRVLPGVSSAYVELVNDVAADLIFYRSRRNRSVLNRISSNVIICRGREAIPMFQSSRKLLKADQQARVIDKPIVSGGKDSPCSMDLGTPSRNEDQEQTSQRVLKLEKPDDEPQVKHINLNVAPEASSDEQGESKNVLPDVPTAAPSPRTAAPIPKLSEAPTKDEAPTLVKNLCTTTTTISKTPAPSGRQHQVINLKSNEHRSEHRFDQRFDQKYDQRFENLFITRLRGYDPDRLKFVLQTLLRKLQPEITLSQIRITWNERNNYAYAEIQTRSGSDLLMNCYIRYTQEVCIVDFPLCIYRHKNYTRPGSKKEESNTPRISEYVYITGIPQDLDEVPTRGALTELFEKSLASSGMLHSNAGFKFFNDFAYYSPGVYRVRFYSSVVCSCLISLNNQFEIAGERITLTLKKEDLSVRNRVVEFSSGDGYGEDGDRSKRQSVTSEERLQKRSRLAYN